MKISNPLLCALGITAMIMTPARACDLCGCYLPQLEPPPQSNLTGPIEQMPGVTEGGATYVRGFYGAVAEQFTHYGTLQLNGTEVANPAEQYLNSSITQLVGGYAFNSRFAVQVNIPLIYRAFRRPEGFTIENGSVSGLGDVSLLGKVVLYDTERGGGREVKFDDPKSPRIEIHEPDFTLSAVFVGGLKFPTGATSRLKEEFNEVEVEGAPASGIHGHDLTLGTGSYDGIMGGRTFLRYKKFFFEQGLDFTLRGDGLHQYHFANDLSWSGGPGYYFVRNQRAIFGLQGVISGEYKNIDRFRGKPAEDTGITSLFAGPRAVASFGRFSGEVAVGFPFLINNTALQAVPDYRISAAFAFRF